MYSDLFSNLHYLNKARKHLEQYLESLSKKQNILPNQSWRLKNDNLRKQMSPQEIDSYINAINLQIECTKFICSYKKETFNDDKPSTLFGNNDAKISLCCQILMAGNSVQEGFGFVIRIIQCFNLSSTLVYTQISRELAKQFNFKEINNLLKCIDESGYKEDKNVTFDECISTCIRVFAAINNENCQNQTSNDTNAFNRHQQVSKYSKEIESLIQLIKSDENKINAFILNGRLKSAYLIAIRLERVDIVKHIANVAERVGQNLIRDICIKWLEKNAK
ncbi:Zinc finger FYVE domain-containing [Brachionus plicatilis]|uniref:Zinc finger FYVE domain-containing n=1 Tax=Brachionus plicatilis TaxID=10195 RepID=A0A3M7QZA6_BRAPC|nr:Zinc finger FYVE domain-containing [Brachionus plicatilis]